MLFGGAQAQPGRALYKHGNIGANRAPVEANELVVNNLFDLRPRASRKLLDQGIDDLSNGTFFIDLFHI